MPCYTLPKLKSVASDESEDVAQIGGQSFTVKASKDLVLSHIGEVLLQIYRFSRLLLAAGFREITPHSETPLAGSCGDQGAIKYKNSTTGAETTVRYHLTPEDADQYFLAALRAAPLLTAKQLAASHHVIMGKVADKLSGNFNLASVLGPTVNETPFTRAYAEANSTLPELPSTPAQDDTPTDTEVVTLRRELKDRENTISQLRRSASAKREAASASGELQELLGNWSWEAALVSKAAAVASKSLTCQSI